MNPSSSENEIDYLSLAGKSSLKEGMLNEKVLIKENKNVTQKLKLDGDTFKIGFM